MSGGIKKTTAATNFAIDILIAMTVDELSTELKKDSNEMLAEFCSSKTAEALYDETTKLWWNGPSYIADMYMDEIKYS